MAEVGVIVHTRNKESLKKKKKKCKKWQVKCLKFCKTTKLNRFKKLQAPIRVFEV